MANSGYMIAFEKYEECMVSLRLCRIKFNLNVNLNGAVVNTVELNTGHLATCSTY